jgi:hypothetical protein
MAQRQPVTQSWKQTMNVALPPNRAEQQKRLTELADIYHGSLCGQRTMTDAERKELSEIFFATMRLTSESQFASL